MYFFQSQQTLCGSFLLFLSIFLGLVLRGSSSFCNNYAGQVVFLMDGSATYENFFKRTGYDFFSEAIHFLKHHFRGDVEFGLAVYENYSVLMNKNKHLKKDSDTCYTLHQPLTSDRLVFLDRFTEVADTLSFNQSPWSSALSAMALALQSKDMGWRNGMSISSKRIVKLFVLLTDVFAYTNPLFQNNPPMKYDGTDSCNNEVPNNKDLTELLIQHEIFPVVLTTSEVSDLWAHFLHSYHVEQHVATLNTENLNQAALKNFNVAVEQACAIKQLKYPDDPEPYFLSPNGKLTEISNKEIDNTSVTEDHNVNGISDLISPEKAEIENTDSHETDLTQIPIESESTTPPVTNYNGLNVSFVPYVYKGGIASDTEPDELVPYYRTSITEHIESTTENSEFSTNGNQLSTDELYGRKPQTTTEKSTNTSKSSGYLGSGKNWIAAASGALAAGAGLGYFAQSYGTSPAPTITNEVWETTHTAVEASDREMLTGIGEGAFAS